MASTVDQQHPFQAGPPPLSAGDHESRDYYAHQHASRPTLNQTSYLTPYLGFRARLSQIVLNRWTILLLLVLVRLLFAIASSNESLNSAQREALSACTQVEKLGSSMASMPHYMASGVNEMTASGVEKAVNGLMSMLEMSVTGVEEIILFVIHMLTSTYLCLITLAVRGSLGAAVEVGQEMVKLLEETVKEVSDGIGNATKSVNEGIDKLIGSLNDLPFVPDFDKPQINLDDQINKLKELKAPPQIQEGLQKLNQSIPTFDEVQNFTDNIIRMPFEEVKKLIRENLDKYQFDRAVLPVPQKEQLNFCAEGNSIHNFFQDLFEMAAQAKKIALGVLIVAAILIIIPMAWQEYRRYRKMEEHSHLFANGHDAMDVVYLASRPHSSSWGLWLGQRFGSAYRQTAARWAFAYATSVPMLFILSLAVAGLFSCCCQYLLVKGIQAKVPELTNQVAGFAEKVITSLDGASMSWSDGVNGAIADMNADINDEVFGWVNTTTTSVNDTLNAFVEKMSGALEDTFGGTPLHEPIKEVLNCLIGLKIASFQKGLTWVKENAHVNFPGVANDTFSLGALAQLSDSSSAAELLADPSGKSKDEVTEAVDHVVRKLISGIQTEAIISTFILCLWLLFAIGGSVYACAYMARRSKVYATNDPYVVNPALTETSDLEKPQEYRQSAAPPYEYPVNKSAPYTIQPRPFPTFSPRAPTAPSGSVRQVDSHAVAESACPGHVRASSHGTLADPSPMDEKRNPFNQPYDEKRNPFSG
ncbi:hypothetical protein M011DRAFT_482282 [Sporormia fimetaria CBS 119925]|uniref:Plasma membrane fusion protein PRM1 n=1 Tax=Sporormia fimetaria CBS 119925 TaxID=1340428 RepID=A0A6A6UXD7_9PLEO|nr:hypothetical protein M011DRAFT_482282 [Sporormia fimetaria CBS 119925]